MSLQDVTKTSSRRDSNGKEKDKDKQKAKEKAKQKKELDKSKELLKKEQLKQGLNAKKKEKEKEKEREKNRESPSPSSPHRDSDPPLVNLPNLDESIEASLARQHSAQLIGRSPTQPLIPDIVPPRSSSAAAVKVSLTDFKVIRLIGKGGFGEVRRPILWQST